MLLHEIRLKNLTAKSEEPYLMYVTANRVDKVDTTRVLIDQARFDFNDFEVQEIRVID